MNRLEASRAAIGGCIQCGLCLPHCPTFRLTGREAASPRGRLTAMAAVADGIAPLDETFAGIIDFCLGCRACEVACPSLVPYGRLLEEARGDIVDASRVGVLRGIVWGRIVDSPLVSLGTIALGLAQRTGMTALVPGSAGRSVRGVRQLRRRPPSRKGQTFSPPTNVLGTIGLLSGCVMDEWFRPVHEATIQVLTGAGYRVVVPKDQVCCGALAAHAGAVVESERLATVNLDAFADVDIVVANAAGCGAHLKEYEHIAGRSLPARDVTEVVADAIAKGLLPTFEPSTRGRVGVQDPCHLRHAQRITEEPTTILRAAGYDPVEIDPTGMCCGAAGAWSVMHPKESAELGRRKAAQIKGVDVDVVASANPGCEMQLRSYTTSVRVAHPVELYAEALRAT